MGNILDSNFELMRFNILNTAQEGIKKSSFKPTYCSLGTQVFIQPYTMVPNGTNLSTDAPMCQRKKWKTLPNFRKVTWKQRTPITFFELETHHKVGDHQSLTQWDRGKLLCGCRCLFLCGIFERELWATLTENRQGRIEATLIVGSLDKHEFDFRWATTVNFPTHLIR